MLPTFTPCERSVEELDANPINPRTLKDTAFVELKQSLEKDPHFLKARPVIVSMEEGRENTVIAGNQRLTAAKALGWKTIPVMEVRGASEEQEREWMVKDNLHKGEWDFEKLANGFDLDFLKEMGFDEKGLNKVLANIDNSADDEFDAEKEAEAIIEPVVQRGEIWQLGEHRLMCGDSTDTGDVALLMDGKKADMVFTDPPYGNGSSGKYGRGQLGVRTILGDTDFEVVKDFFNLRVCDVYVFFLQWRTFKEAIQTLESNNLQLRTIAVWDKKNAGLNGAGGMSEQWEAILVAGNVEYSRFGGNVFSVSREHKKRIDSPHPHQKPVELLNNIFEYFQKYNLLFDPFLGSGSTLIACENTKRVCYGMEIDPKYCDVIIKRWEEKTGKKAVKTQV
jgi:DNA modification methylase